MSFFALVALVLSLPAFSQTQTLHKVWDSGAAKPTPTSDEEQKWKIETLEGRPFCLHYADGGSLGVVFQKNDEEVTLILDRSSIAITIKGTDGFPDTYRFEERNDGLLYLGEENFKKRIPLNVRSHLFLEMEKLLEESIEKYESDVTDDLSLFLDSAKRMRSNQTHHTTAVSAPRWSSRMCSAFTK